ncbi:MAG: hypothetical protein IJY12_05090 [Clostridia bacterium]|nr:hypothetical protein [Clostridia bacterium]
MKNKSFRLYCFLTLAGVLLASYYPIYMGVSVVSDMIRHGTVYAESYPKYIIPYTPIALALIVGVALMPLILRLAKKSALLVGSALSTAVFFAAELLLESMVTVTKTVTETVPLENWQMYMCYVPSKLFTSRAWTEVDVLMGEYSPAFKMHFYLIALVLIVSLLNCFYGFAAMIATGDRGRLKPLILQSVASVAFLGMCIWACFTAFYRTGEVRVSALSAVLMSVFFVLFGVTAGIYVASFTHRKKLSLSVVLPAAVASAITLLMYIGEMILLSGHLYRFGNGFFFTGLPGIVLAPADLVIILLSGAVTAALARAINKSAGNVSEQKGE